jgi:glucokinase
MTIGIDIGGSNIKGVLMKGSKVIVKRKIYHKSKSNKKKLIAQIFKCIEDLISKNKGRVRRIGIGIAGPLDLKRQKVLNPPNVTGLKNIYLANLIKKKFKIKTILDNDVNCLVLAEAILGAAKEDKFVVGLGLGTGVGGGIVINKKLFYGPHDSAGEFGHMIIQKDGRFCHCGSKGCLEVYTNEKGLRHTAKEILGKRINSIALENLAKKGNKKAIKAWQITGQYLGIGLANLVNVLDPDIIVVGGGIARAGELLLNSAKKEMKKNILSPLAKNTRVVRAKLGEYAGAIGAGLLHF